MELAPHADPFLHDGRPDPNGRRIGVLLSHGFTGSPASMRPWGEYLADRGYTVSAPRLPGHGTHWREMVATTHDDWYAEVERELDDLAGRTDAVVVGGLSMGGGLALWLAARHPDQVAGLILVNPAVASADKRLKAAPVLKRVVRSVPAIGDDIKKQGVSEHAYDRTPLAPLHSMMRGWRQVRADLPRVTCPVLLFRSREDHVVDPSSARIILGGISTRDATERLLEDSFHVATLDNDAPMIFAESADFIERVTKV